MEQIVSLNMLFCNYRRDHHRYIYRNQQSILTQKIIHRLRIKFNVD